MLQFGKLVLLFDIPSEILMNDVRNVFSHLVMFYAIKIHFHENRMYLQLY